jgi:hypothetical protein
MHPVTVDEWVDLWRARASRATPLTAGEWIETKEAIFDAYVLAGLARPQAMIRTHSPREALDLASEHCLRPPRPNADAGARIAAAIQRHEQRALRSISFTGEIASRVDGGGLSVTAWRNDLHPEMLRSPGAGNMRVGVAAEVSWILASGGEQSGGASRGALRAIIGRSAAGPARWLGDLVFVSDLPTMYLMDEEGRPHGEDGPALAWADGTTLSLWHGVRVPDDFFAWDVQHALSTVNAEVRRCAFERLGFDDLERFLLLIAEAPDPANPPHLLRLYAFPRPWLPGRLLVVDNASIDKGGHRRRFQIFVPPHIDDPVDAAANSFGLSADEYRRMQRAT